MCLFNAIEGESVGREDAIRKTAEWAKQNLGLEYSRLSRNSVVWKGIDAAIIQAVKDKEIKETVFYGVVKIQVVG